MPVWLSCEGSDQELVGLTGVGGQEPKSAGLCGVGREKPLSDLW